MSSILDIQKKYYKKLDFLDTEILLAHSLKKTREFVLTHPEFTVTSNQQLAISKNIKRRIKGEPVAYIVGHKEFYGLDFVVDKNTLIPRPETELLVDLTLQELKAINYKPTTILDIGTGSGNIIISLEHTLDSRFRGNDMIKYFATDISKNALKIAKRNSKINNVDKKIKFILGDLLSPFIENCKLKIENSTMIIVANLPYLDANWKNLLKSSDKIGLKFEPSVALYAGKDGLDAYRKLAEQIKAAKIKNSVLFCEIGHLQGKGMRKIFSFAKSINFHKDLAGKWRICKIAL
jgi:release factor glutamine methyltransferase